MRERAITTSIIWIALAVSIDQILNSINEFTSGSMQFGLLVMMGILAIAAVGATVAIWQNAAASERRAASANASDSASASAEKAKRDGREVRIQRLLESMDDEDLDLLEGRRLTSEEERLSLESLLRKRG